MLENSKPFCAAWLFGVTIHGLPSGVCRQDGVRAKSDSSVFFLVRSLSQFVGDLPKDRLLCPVRIYLDLTSSISPQLRSLFVSPRAPSRSLLKNALSFVLGQVIIDTDAFLEGLTPRAHSICGVATSVAFLHKWLVSKVCEAATWKWNPVFALFYFWDLTFSLDGCSSLGPFVAVGSSLK